MTDTPKYRLIYKESSGKRVELSCNDWDRVAKHVHGLDKLGRPYQLLQYQDGRQKGRWMDMHTGDEA